MFRYFGKRLKKSGREVWQHDNHPIALYSESVVIQKLRYIHNNPVEAKWVQQPEDWLYSSAGNYATESMMCNCSGLAWKKTEAGFMEMLTIRRWIECVGGRLPAKPAGIVWHDASAHCCLEDGKR